MNANSHTGYFLSNGSKISLGALEKVLRRPKTTLGVHKRSEFLTGENCHQANSLLLAINYGTPEDVETIKKLIVKEDGRTLVNKAHNKRVKMSSLFWHLHRDKIDFDLHFCM